MDYKRNLKKLAVMVAFKHVLVNVSSINLLDLGLYHKLINRQEICIQIFAV